MILCACARWSESAFYSCSKAHFHLTQPIYLFLDLPSSCCARNLSAAISANVTPPRKKTRVTFWSAILECEEVTELPENNAHERTFSKTDNWYSTLTHLHFHTKEHMQNTFWLLISWCLHFSTIYQGIWVYAWNSFFFFFFHQFAYILKYIWSNGFYTHTSSFFIQQNL